MPDAAHVIAGRWTTVFEGTREQRGSATETGLACEQEQHGDMVVLVKPDSTS